MGDIIYGTRSTTTNFIRGDDKEERGSGALKVGDDINVISVFALVAAEFNDPNPAILLIQSSINVNIMQVFFQNIFLSWIIWEINYYYDQLLIIQVITTIIVLIWALNDVINGYLLLCLVRFDSITINLSAASIIDNNLPNIPRGYAIICSPRGMTSNYIRCDHDREEAGDGVVLELTSSIQVLAAIIVLIWAYFTLFTLESDLIAVNSSAGLIIDNNVSNIQPGYGVAGELRVTQFYKSNIHTNFNFNANGNANNSSNENGDGGSSGLLGAISNIDSNIPGFTDLIGGYANQNDGKHYTNDKEFNQVMYRTQTMSEVVTKSHAGDLRSIDDTSYNLLSAQGGAPISTQTSASYGELELFSNLMFGYHPSAISAETQLVYQDDVTSRGASPFEKGKSLSKTRNHGIFSSHKHSNVHGGAYFLHGVLKCRIEKFETFAVRNIFHCSVGGIFVMYPIIYHPSKYGALKNLTKKLKNNNSYSIILGSSDVSDMSFNFENDTKNPVLLVSITINSMTQLLHFNLSNQLCMQQSNGILILAYLLNNLSSCVLSGIGGITENNMEASLLDYNLGICVNRRDTIKLTVKAGTVTLMTKSFGHGTDFDVIDREVANNGGAHVIQTFFGEEKREEKQKCVHELMIKIQNHFGYK